MELIADVGGTNTRCALVGPGSRPERIHAVANDRFENLEALLAGYLALQGVAAPDAVRLAIAAPAEQLPVRLTNRDWTIDPERIGARLAVARVEVMNDCAAMALATPLFEGPELEVIRAAPGAGDAPRVVVAPGTGLGTAAVVRCERHWMALAAEGGHVTAAAAADDEVRVLEILRRRFPHVSAERVLCGQGLVNLYAAVAELRGEAAAEVTPEHVTGSRDDPVALQSCALFLSMLGGFAGNLALSLGARGGVYLAGGILPQLDRGLLRARLAPAFPAKGRFRPWLEAVPVWLVTHPQPALVGLASRAGR